jgi:hypothetical protein
MTLNQRTWKRGPATTSSAGAAAAWTQHFIIIFYFQEFGIPNVAFAYVVTVMALEV